MFLGEYHYTIDDKGRLTIPAKFRRPLLDGMVVTRGLDRNLAIYPMDAWSRLAEQVEQTPFGDPEARRLRRLVFSGASDVEFDKQGRVKIPDYLLEFGKISKDVVVAGMNAYIEVWSPELWNTVQAGLEDEDNASRWPNLGN
jgi:MraZ protein